MASTDTVTTAQPNYLAVEKQKLDHDEAKAKERQAILLRGLADRKAAPGKIRVGATYHDQLFELQKRLCPDSLTPWEREGRPMTDQERRKNKGVFRPGATKRFYTDSADKHLFNIGEGWVPVRESDGSHAMYRGDLCYERAMELTRDAIRRAGEMSAARRRDKDTSMARAEAEGGGNVIEDETDVEVDAKKTGSNAK